MVPADSDDETAARGADSGSEETSDFGSSGSESEGEEPSGVAAPAAKRRRVNGNGLGLELVAAGAHAAVDRRAAAADIDGSEEAEASLLALEVAELLREARPDGAEPALLQLLAELAAALRGLPQAEVTPAEAAAVRGFLSDLAFEPVVSCREM